jgi:hypothetical protein
MAFQVRFYKTRQQQQRTQIDRLKRDAEELKKYPSCCIASYFPIDSSFKESTILWRTRMLSFDNIWDTMIVRDLLPFPIQTGNAQ